MTLRTQIYFWVGSFALFLGCLWVLGDILIPFVLGLAIAYLLNPLVGRMGKIGLPRWGASLVILIAFIVLIALLVMLIVPPAYQQLVGLAGAMPGYLESLIDYAMPYISHLQGWFDGDLEGNVQNIVKDNIGKILSAGGGLAAGLAGGGQALAGFLSLVVLTPLVAFFMMNEWPRMTQFVRGLYPRQHQKTIQKLASAIDQKISGFVRGQISVAFMLALVYAVALTIADLNYGFLIGLGSGILSIIPLVGSTLGLVVGVLVAWFQGGELGFVDIAWFQVNQILYVGIIAAIFIVGQIIEGNILTPKLVGDSVGLHPLWIIFALLAGGAMFGILGMLLAVPVTAVIGVLLGFAIAQYKGSKLYQSGSKKRMTKKQKQRKAARG